MSDKLAQVRNPNNAVNLPPARPEPVLEVVNRMQNVPVTQIGNENKEVYELIKRAQSNGYKISATNFNPNTNDSTYQISKVFDLGNNQKHEFQIGPLIVLKNNVENYIQKRNSKFAEILKIHLDNPPILPQRRADDIIPFPIDVIYAPELNKGLRERNLRVMYVSSDKVGDSFVDTYAIYDRQTTYANQFLSHMITVPRNSRNYFQEYRDGLTEIVATKNIKKIRTEEIFYVNEGQKEVSSFTVSQKLAPELYSKLSEMRKLGFQVWMKEYFKGNPSFVIVDTGNADRFREDSREFENAFSMVNKDIFNDPEKRNHEFVESISSILKHSEKKDEYLRRNELTKKIEDFTKNQDILGIVNSAQKLTEKEMFLGDEMRHSQVLFIMLKDQWQKQGNSITDLYSVKTALLHTLEKINEYDSDYFTKLNKEQIRNFTFELAKYLIKENQKLAEEPILDSETKLIVVLGNDQMFQKNNFYDIADRFKIKPGNLLIVKGTDLEDRNSVRYERVLKELETSLSKKDQKVVFWTHAHGFDQGVLFGEEKSNDDKKEKSETFFLIDDLRKILTKEENQKNGLLDLRNLTLIFDQCHSYDMAVNLAALVSEDSINNMKFSSKHIPGKIITSSIRGSVVYVERKEDRGFASPLAELILDHLPKEADTLNYADLKQLDILDNIKKLDPELKTWKYHVSSDSGEDPEKYFTQGDISVFNNSLTEPYSIVNGIAAKLKKQGKPIIEMRPREPKPIQIEVQKIPSPD